MQSIDELMKDQAPGDILVYKPLRRDSSWFRPYYYTCGFWHGINHKGFSEHYLGDYSMWELYQKPKKTVTRWLWVRDGVVLSEYMWSEKELENTHPGTKHLWVKLPWSATEVEIDE